jgi:hypothetical protein
MLHAAAGGLALARIHRPHGLKTKGTSTKHMLYDLECRYSVYIYN